MYASLPWLLRLFVRAESGLRGAKQTQLLATAVLFAAVVFAFVPTFLSVVAWVAITWIIGGLIALVNVPQSLEVGRFVVSVVGGAMVMNAQCVTQVANSPLMEH